MTVRKRVQIDKPCGGFTLLEVLIAFIIAAIALSVLFSGSLQGLLSVQAATAYEQAVSRARSHLAAEAVTLVPGEREGDDGGGFRWHVRVRPAETFRRKPEMGRAIPAAGVTAEPIGVTLYAVEVAITWIDARRSREVRLVSERLGPMSAGLP